MRYPQGPMYWQNTLFKLHKGWLQMCIHEKMWEIRPERTSKKHFGEDQQAIAEPE
jgi:hypothetical protein